MNIRLMTINDYEKVYGLWISCKGMGLNDIDDSKEGIEKFLKRNPDTCFIAEEKNNIVGAILSGSDGRRGYIYHTAVAADHRGQGVGKRLVETALTALKNIGITKTALVVFGKNELGNGFWQKMGFTVRDDLVYRNRALVKTARTDT